MPRSSSNREWKATAALLFFAAAFLFTSRCPAQARTLNGASPAPPSLPVLQTTRAVRDLAGKEAARSYPVHLRAVVVYYDPRINSETATFFVHDATGGIFVWIAARPVLALTAGDLVDLRGVTEEGFFAPQIAHPRLVFLGHSQTPHTAPKVTLTQLRTGTYDSQWVEVKGVVHAATPQGQNIMVKLAMDGGLISATTIRQPGVDYERLIDARVRMRAVAGSQFNKRRQLTGVHLFFPSLRELDVQRYGAPDPFSLPVRAADAISRFEPGQTRVDRFHLRGRVTLQWPGKLLCIQDASAGLCVQTTDKTPLPKGSLVDVVGFAGFDGAAPTLTEAIVRRTSAAAVPVATVHIRAAQGVQGSYVNSLVSIDGEIVGSNSDPKSQALIIVSDGEVFPALLPGGVANPGSSKWAKGSRVRVTGICTAEADSQDGDDRQGFELLKSFSILLRSPGDVIVVHSPSWWSPFHTAEVLAVGVLVLLLVLCWAAMLRRRVREQTQLIRESEERFRHLAHHDPLTGLANRSLLHDRLGVALEHAKRNHERLALLMLDLDRFKEVNDTLGHAGGDQLLCAAADRLRACVRKSDTVARMGGDEFIVLLCGLFGASEAQEIAAKTFESLAAPLAIGARTIPIWASIGVCTFPEAGSSVGELLANADAAMYQAKALGRNRCERFTPEVTVKWSAGERKLTAAEAR